MCDPQMQNETNRGPEVPSEAETTKLVQPEEEILWGDDERSVFPHYLLLIPVAVVLAGLDYLLFSHHHRGVFSFESIDDGDSGTLLMDLSFFHAPILLVALLFFAYWGCRFALEGEASSREMLRHGFLFRVGMFVVSLFIEWLLIV